MRRVFKVCCLICLVITTQGCVGVAVGALSTAASNSDVLGRAARAKSLSSDTLFSSEEILDKRGYQTRKFLEKDFVEVMASLSNTLNAVGFTSNAYDQQRRLGLAYGADYQLVYFVRTVDEKIYIRISISSLKRQPITNETYSQFWDALGKVKFLQTIPISAEELS